MTPVALFRTHGGTCEASTAKPLDLAGTASAWLVDAGKADLFLTRRGDGHTEGALHPLFRVESGDILYGMPEDAASDGWTLVAIGIPGTRLLRLDRERLPTDVPAGTFTDGWLTHLASALAHLPPEASAALEPGRHVVPPEQAVLSTRNGLWLTLERGTLRLLGRPEGIVEHCDASLPIPRTVWLEACGEASFEVSSGDAPQAGWAGFDCFQRAAFALLIADLVEDDARDRLRRAGQAEGDAARIDGAMRRLSAILHPSSAPHASAVSGGSPLLAACRIVGNAAGIEFVPPVGALDGRAQADVLAELVEASRVRHRRVALKGAWWTRDNGHLLAFLDEGEQPVALIRTASGYTLSNPASPHPQALTPEVAATLRPFAYSFQRSFGDALVGVTEMVRLAGRGNGRDYLTVALMGVACGLLGMATPMATGMLFDTVIPGAERSQLLQLTIALMAAAFATAMFEITRGFAMLRAEGKMDSAVQAAVWDRLLRLPAPFFRDYSAGDLAMRANGINTIRAALSGNTLHTLLAAVFSSFNLLLLFYYSLKLALVAIALVALAILFTVAVALLRLRHERKLWQVDGRISGMVFQFLGGIAKLRTTAAEGRAFCNWADAFAEQQEHAFKAKMAHNAMEVFNAVFPLASSLAIFATVAFFLKDDASLSTGSFLAFNAAFGGFLGAMLGTTAALTTIMDMVPVYERAKPILCTAPEIDSAKAHPGRLGGALEISHVSFSYAPDAPLVLRDVSLRVEPGEFVALVGASGSGKSTLLRLLLGFETPTEGAIYYDHQDLAGVDPGALRRQLGVVLQNGQVMPGDVFTNIVGSSATLTLDDAWEAARQAGIADDIRAMPMGMHTVVSDGGGTLSGGQRQRLLIARAIVNRPRILYFDEATSALDNRTQETVSRSLENLRATRIVIAHRLSTIVNADRIVVLDGGRLVQSGSYEELMDQPGHFRDLAQRQIV